MIKIDFRLCFLPLDLPTCAQIHSYNIQVSLGFRIAQPFTRVGKLPESFKCLEFVWKTRNHLEEIKGARAMAIAGKLNRANT